MRYLCQFAVDQYVSSMLETLELCLIVGEFSGDQLLWYFQVHIYVILLTCVSALYSLRALHQTLYTRAQAKVKKGPNK